MSKLNDLPDTARLVAETPLLDFSVPSIQSLIRIRRWSELETYGRVGAAYTFVRDEIAFGYNESDDLPASRVLAAGFGQCNTKGTLLMALLRALDVPCRFHGFTIAKAPDEFHAKHGSNLSGLKRLLFRGIVRHWMNRTVARTRNGG